MLWIVATVVTAIVLAWRRVSLSHATGMLGCLLLLYGWKGGSNVLFLLQLAAFVAVAVLLNNKSLRQEWLTRPLLERLLPSLPSKAREASEPEAGLPCLLDGDWRYTLPASSALPSAMEQQALQSLLLARLRSPLMPVLEGAAPGQLATLLYSAASLRSVALPRANADAHLGSPQPAAGLRPELHWPMAAAMADVGGGCPAAVLKPLPSHLSGADGTALLEQTSRWQAVVRAAQISNAYERMIAFDTAVFEWLGHCLTLAAQALVNGLSGGWFLPLDDVDDDDLPRQRTRLSSQTRLALLCNLWLAAKSFGRSDAAAQLTRELAEPLGGALHAQWQWQALHQYWAAGTSPGLELPLLQAAHQAVAEQAEQAQWRGVNAIQPFALRWGMKGLLFPTGRHAQAAGYETVQKAGECFEHLADVRERLAGAAAADITIQLLSRYAQLARLHGALSQLAAARFEPCPANEAERLAAALRMGFIDESQHAVLVEALAFAQTLGQDPRGVRE